MGTPGSLSSPPKARCAMVGPLCALFSRFLHHSSPSALPAPPPSAPPPRPPPPAAVATGESGERRRVRRRGCKPHLATIPRPATMKPAVCAYNNPVANGDIRVRQVQNPSARL
jgi:hypothetical protein